MWSADIQLMPLRGLRTYGELLIDDISFSSAYKPLQVGFQIGGHLTYPSVPLEALSFRAEYTRVFNYVYSVWYHHDYVYHDRALGYFLGPDSEDIFFRWSVDTSRSTGIWIDLERQRHGEGRLGSAWDEGRLDRPDDTYDKKSSTEFQGIVETTYRFAATGRLWLSDYGTAFLSCGYFRKENTDNVLGRTEDGLLLETRLSLSF
jgi:hypothetical protein